MSEEEEDVNGIRSTEAEIDEEHKFSKSDNTKISSNYYFCYF